MTDRYWSTEERRWIYGDEAAATGGAWVTYYADRSGFALFATEIEALRHAAEASMQVRFVEWGGAL